MNSAAPEVACPLCGAENNRLIVDGGAWRIRACRACTNAWTDPPPGSVPYETRDFHSETLASEGEPSLENLPRVWREAILEQVAMLQRHLPAGARVLEIGCGAGLMLGALRDAGFETVGIEPSYSAQKRAQAHGLNVYQGYFPSVELSSGEAPFAAVVMSHVLEHIATPIETLKALSTIAPAGKVLLVQTDWRGLVPRVRGAKWYAWVPDEHFWHFTPAGLERMTQGLGVKPVAHEYSQLVPLGKVSRLLSAVTRLAPRWRDQFHLLLQLPSP